jgi:hypothetical protein
LARIIIFFGHLLVGRTYQHRLTCCFPQSAGNFRAESCDGHQWGEIVFQHALLYFTHLFFLQVHCISQLQDGLYFVLTAVDNISPSLGFEILGRIVKVLKDYCGVLDEETVPYLLDLLCSYFAIINTLRLPRVCSLLR